MKKMTALLLDQQYKEEADFLKKAKEWLEAQRDIKCIRVSERYQRGYSDLFLCVRGQFVVAELKDDTGTASPHQELFIADVIRAGGIGAVCYTMRDILNLVDEARSRRPEWT
jgi:hypothetical protein